MPQITSLNDRLIKKPIRIALRNWTTWRDVYEHVGDVSTIPLLDERDRFASFCNEYKVSRTIRKGTREKLRKRLKNSPKFSKAIRDDTGRSLDELERKLRRAFGTYNGTRGMISVLSKVAAFARPEQFVAWDSYAKRGLNIVQGRSPYAPFQTYAEYLRAFDGAWKGWAGREIRDYVRRNVAQTAVEKKRRFQRRVLDVSFMQLGGRWQ